MCFQLERPAILLALSCLLVSCTQVNVDNTAPKATAETKPAASTEATDVATASPAPETTTTTLASATTAVQPAAPTEIAALQQTAPAANAKTVSFSDISGITAEQPIKDLATLGIIEHASDTFKPFEPVTRAEYVRWVVKANNKFSKTDQTAIRLAETPDATFVDMKPSHPDFKYIQGLANAGYIVGIDATHFAPDKPITREEMVMIKAQMDEGSELKPGQFDKRYVYFSDVDSINPDYIGAMYHDSCATTTNNVTRIWGSIKSFKPKKALTRSEAAISVSKTRSGSAKDILASS